MSEPVVPFQDGPSRECLYDCLRLGQGSRDFRTVRISTDSFHFEGETFEPFDWHIEIEGIHRADKVGLECFFFGRQLHVLRKGTVHLAPLDNNPKFRFVLGRLSFWKNRSGTLRFKDWSFFTNPLHQ